MSTLTNSQSNINLILNQIPKDVFTDSNFDMSKYPSEVFLLEDTSIPVFVISNKKDYDDVSLYLSAAKKHENKTSSSAVVISSSNYSGTSNIKPSTIYLAVYTNSIIYNAIGGKTENYIHAVDLKTVNDVDIKI